MNPLLAEGLTDAIGFLAGSLLVYGLARLLGFDPLAQDSGAGTIAGIVLAGLAGGGGVQVARRIRAARQRSS